MHGRFAAAILATALSSFALPAGAQEANVSAPGSRKHDGFFLQLQPGPAYLHLGYTDDEHSTGHRFNVIGFGFGLNVAVGKALTENLVIFGEVMSQYASSPTTMDDGRSTDYHDASYVAFINIGPGAAYYFGESGFFLSGLIGVAGSKEKADHAEYHSNGGGLWVLER